MVMINNNPLLGYPIETAFNNMVEVKAYLEQSKITCLLCGREYSHLGNHISRAHMITIDDYKEKYGLPWGRSLAGKDLRKKLSEKLKETRASGKIPATSTKEHIERMQQKALNKRKMGAAALKSLVTHLPPEGNGKVKEKTSQKNMKEYLRRIKTGRTIQEVSQDLDMPHTMHFYKLLGQDPDFREKFEKIWDSLPFFIQIKGQKSGPRLVRKVVELRLQKLTWPEIGRIMKLKEGTPRSIWFKLKKSNKLEEIIADISKH